MCGRYSIAVEGEKLQRYSAARLTFPYVPRYNAAPSQDLPVILNESPEKIVAVRWGLKPPWIRSIKRDGLINVRSDTLKERATFNKDLLERRCLVLADGFYEWKGTSSGRKIPYRFVRKDRSLFAFAGLWQMNRDKDGNDLRTFAIITTNASAPVKAIHDRMPVILKREEESIWLSRATGLPQIWDVMKNSEARSLTAYEVSRALNNAKNDSPDLIVPASDGQPNLHAPTLFAEVKRDGRHRSRAIQ